MDDSVTIIADSGSTKTEWAVINKDKCLILSTKGINPIQMTLEDIEAVISRQLVQSLQKHCAELLTDEPPSIDFFFYGAGCTPDKAVVVSNVLRHVFKSAKNVEVKSDMLGAAKAVAGDSQAIVCILGTGANSCYYDGKNIIDNVPPLGFILGDEGSGAYIGKRLVADCIKRQLNETTINMFQQEFNLTVNDVINKTYREKNPNRFLASLSTFCANHRQLSDIHRLLVDAFSQFFIRNVALYDKHRLDVDFVGSIAYVYESELKEAAMLNGFKIGKIIQKPIIGLVEYHKSHRI